MTLPLLSLAETRVMGVLVEKERTVPDIYPLSLNALTSGCNQKNNRDPLLSLGETEVQAAVDRLKPLSLVIESSGSRVMGVFHVPFTAGAGASSTGRRWTVRAARASLAASFAAATTPSFVIVLVAAKPHEPPTSARTPSP